MRISKKNWAGVETPARFNPYPMKTLLNYSVCLNLCLVQSDAVNVAINN